MPHHTVARRRVKSAVRQRDRGPARRVTGCEGATKATTDGGGDARRRRAVCDDAVARPMAWQMMTWVRLRTNHVTAVASHGIIRRWWLAVVRTDGRTSQTAFETKTDASRGCIEAVMHTTSPTGTTPALGCIGRTKRP